MNHDPNPSELQPMETRRSSFGSSRPPLLALAARCQTPNMQVSLCHDGFVKLPTWSASDTCGGAGGASEDAGNDLWMFAY